MFFVESGKTIPNFAGVSILSCQHFQENVNETRNAVNGVRKIVNLFSKATVNHIRQQNITTLQPYNLTQGRVKGKRNYLIIIYIIIYIIINISYRQK